MLTKTKPDRLRFMNNDVTVHVAQADNADRLSVIGSRMPFGEAAPAAYPS